MHEQQYAIFTVPFRVFKDDGFSSTHLTVTKSESVCTCSTTVAVISLRKPEPNFSQCLTEKPSQMPPAKLTSTTAVPKISFNRCMAET